MFELRLHVSRRRGEAWQGREEGVTIVRGFDVPADAIAAVLAAKIAVVLGVISDGEDQPRRLHRSRSTFKEALRPFPDWGPY